MRLRIIYNLAAGYTTHAAVTAGCAIRIMTGAPIPPGGDAIAQFEDTGRWVNGATAGKIKEEARISTEVSRVVEKLQQEDFSGRMQSEF